MKNVIIIIIFLFLAGLIYIFTGTYKCKVEYQKETTITQDYKIKDNHIYYIGINSLKIRYHGKYKSIKYLLSNNKININKLLNRLDKSNISVVSCNNNIIFSKEYYQDKYCHGINVINTKIEVIDNIKNVKIDDKYKKVFNVDAKEGEIVKVYYDDNLNILSVNKIDICNNKGC